MVNNTSRVSIAALRLTLLVESGLVVKIQDHAEQRYQLFHDYIATFIRRTQRPMLVQLEEERQRRAEAEKKQLRQSQRAAIGLGALLIVAIGAWGFCTE